MCLKRHGRLIPSAKQEVASYRHAVSLIGRAVAGTTAAVPALELGKLMSQHNLSGWIGRQQGNKPPLFPYTNAGSARIDAKPRDQPKVAAQGRPHGFWAFGTASFPVLPS